MDKLGLDWDCEPTRPQTPSSSSWFPRSSSEARPSSEEFGRTARAYPPLSMWPPGSGLNCSAAFCTSGGFRPGHQDKHLLKRSLSENPRVMRAWPVYDGLQSPHPWGVVLAWQGSQTPPCSRGSRHSVASGPYAGKSYACCGHINMTLLRSRLSFLKGLAPSATTRAGFSGSSREPPAGALGALRVTVRASLLGIPKMNQVSSWKSKLLKNAYKSLNSLVTL